MGKLGVVEVNRAGKVENNNKFFKPQDKESNRDLKRGQQKRWDKWTANNNDRFKKTQIQ